MPEGLLAWPIRTPQPGVLPQQPGWNDIGYKEWLPLLWGVIP